MELIQNKAKTKGVHVDIVYDTTKCDSDNTDPVEMIVIDYQILKKRYVIDFIAETKKGDNE